MRVPAKNPKRAAQRLQEHRGFLGDVYFSFCELDGSKSSVPLSASCCPTFFLGGRGEELRSGLCETGR